MEIDDNTKILRTKIDNISYETKISKRNILKILSVYTNGDLSLLSELNNKDVLPTLSIDQGRKLKKSIFRGAKPQIGPKMTKICDFQEEQAFNA